MSTWSGLAWRTLMLSTALAIGLASNAAAATPPSTPPVDGATISAISSGAESQGALGVYLDSAGQPVVVLPSARAKSLNAASLTVSGVTPRIQATDIDRNAKQGIHDDLVSLRTSIDSSYDYAFYFDLPTVTMIVQTNAPESSFANVVAKHPGHIRIDTGAKGGATYSRQADASSFWGGARTYSSGMAGGDHLCSTGFEAVRSGYIYMSTAGHCYVHYTNVYSGAGQLEGYVSCINYPKYDIEWIYGGSYSPVIYNGASGDDQAHVNVYGRNSLRDDQLFVQGR
jgi:hypothetical protein